jgi:hypothetical protein
LARVGPKPAYGEAGADHIFLDLRFAIPIGSNKSVLSKKSVSCSEGGKLGATA